MATEAVLTLAVAIVSMLLPLMVIKHMAHRIILHHKGEDAAARSAEASRLVITCGTALAMAGAVFFLGPQTVAPEMLPTEPASQAAEADLSGWTAFLTASR